MKFKFIFVCALVVACKGTQKSADVSDSSWLNGLFSKTDFYSQGTTLFAPGGSGNNVISVDDNTVNVATDLYASNCDSGSIEVTAWSGLKAGIAWTYNNRRQGKLLLGTIPEFNKESYPTNIDIALGNEGETAMLVFQAQGRVFYSVYRWTDKNAFQRVKGPIRMGNYNTVGYGSPKIDCDTENDDRVAITWASYQGKQTNTETQEIWAISGYIDGNLFRVYDPVPVSMSAGVDRNFDCKRPDVACKNGKVYITYDCANEQGKHYLTLQEINWNALQDADATLPEHRVLRTGDKGFKWPKIAAKKERMNELEWQIVASEEFDGKRRIIGFTGFPYRDSVSMAIVSDSTLNKCNNYHPGLCIGEEYVIVAWVHDDDSCTQGLVEKDILVQRLSITDGRLSRPNEISRLNSQQIGDQLAVSVAGSRNCDFLHFGFFDASSREVVTKSSHYGSVYLAPQDMEMNFSTTLDENQNEDHITNHGIEGSCQIQVHPNPASDFLQINFGGNWEPNVLIELYNENAVLLKSIQASSRQAFQLNVSALENGFVYIQVKDGHQTFARRVQIQH